MGKEPFRRLIEHSYCLDVKTLRQQGCFRSNKQGECRWYNGWGDRVGIVWYRVTLGEKGYGEIQFHYIDVWYVFYLPWGETIKTEERIALTATPCRYGGKRWWLLCPPSNKHRVTKLYAPYSSPFFKCRNCHELIYRSQRVESPLRWMRRIVYWGMKLEQKAKKLIKKDNE